MREWLHRKIGYLLIIVMVLSLFGGVSVCAQETEKKADGAIAYLQREYFEPYTYGYEWIVFTLLRAEVEVSQIQLNSYYNSVVNEIQSWNDTQKPTDMERVALALSALGKDITDVEGVNLAAMIYNSDKLGEGSNELVYALLALDAKATEIPSDSRWSREQMVHKLLTFQNVSGGFGLADNSTVSVDTTAMALQALAPYRQDAEVDAAIEKGLEYLISVQSDDYGFGSAESTAQVLIALSSLGRSPVDATGGFGNEEKNIITNLNQYYLTEPSGFVHELGKTKPDSMATIQALQAYTAYQLYVEGREAYWDLTAVNNEGLLVPTTITLQQESCSIFATGELQLNVQCSNSEDRVVKYESLDTKVVRISETGLMTGVKAGKTKIIVTSASGATAMLAVKVKKPKIKLNVTKGKLQVKKSTNALRVVEKLSTDKVVKWKSSNKKVVTVSKKGKLTARKVGKATITVTMKSGATATCKVTVQKKAVKKGIKFKKSTYKLKVNDTMKTSYKLTNSFDKVKSYKSSNKKVVKISKKGILKGIKPGTARITVITANGAKATAKVVVKKK